VENKAKKEKERKALLREGELGKFTPPRKLCCF